MYIAHGRSEATVALFPVLILQIDAQYGFSTLSYGDVAYKYIFDDSTPAGTGFYADHPVQIRAVHLAIFNKQVAIAAGYFTTDNNATMPVFHFTVAYDDVLAGYIPFAPVCIASRFDGDTIVTGIKSTVLYQYILTGFRIASISVGTTVEYIDTAYNQTFAKQRVNHPKRRVQ